MPSPQMWRDDNTGYLSDTAGLGSLYTAAGIKAATTGAATAEVDISGFFGLGATQNGYIIVRIVNVGTNAALYAFDKAGQGASHTGNANMMIIPPNWVDHRRVDPAQVSFYHQQVGGSSTIQVSVIA